MNKTLLQEKYPVFVMEAPMQLANETMEA